jgi:hypothetical protein
MLFSSTGVSGKSVPENRHSKPKTTSEASKIHFLISIQLLNSRQKYKINFYIQIKIGYLLKKSYF